MLWWSIWTTNKRSQGSVKNKLITGVGQEMWKINLERLAIPESSEEIQDY